MRRAFAAGTFDGLHPGHVAFLKHAARQGKLSVAVARDGNVLKTKGSKTFFNEKERLSLVSAIKFVSKAFLGSKQDYLDAVVKAKPDVVVLGHDQKVDGKRLEKALKERGVRVRVVRAPAFKRARYRNALLKRGKKGHYSQC